MFIKQVFEIGGTLEGTKFIVEFVLNNNLAFAIDCAKKKKKVPLVGSLCLGFVTRNWSILIGYFHSYHVRTKERNILPLRDVRVRNVEAGPSGQLRKIGQFPADSRFRLKWVKSLFLFTFLLNFCVLRCELENRQPAPPAVSPHITLCLYRIILTEEFNFGFGLPRTDTCARCDALIIAIKSTSGDDLGHLRQEQAEHHRHADAGYSNKLPDQKAADQSWSENSQVVGGEVPYRCIDALDIITFYFQQNLPAPNLHHRDVFFARQLWTYNFRIHDCGQPGLHVHVERDDRKVWIRRPLAYTSF